MDDAVVAIDRNDGIKHVRDTGNGRNVLEHTKANDELDDPRRQNEHHNPDEPWSDRIDRSFALAEIFWQRARRRQIAQQCSAL